MASNEPEIYDLILLVDATYSMYSYLESLQISLPKVIQISSLTDCFSRIGILAYRDYCDRQLLEWSGWFSPSSEANVSQVDLVAMAKKLEPIGGGDGPEATKTGLARAYELMREDAKTIVLLYTDAPPHTFANGTLGDRDSNFGPERKTLESKTAFGGFSRDFMDIVTAADRLSGRVGEKKAQIFSILQANMRFKNAGYYNYLSAMTNGACVYLDHSTPTNISKVTIELLLSWMGVEKAGNKHKESYPGSLTRYKTVDDLELLKGESDPKANLFFECTTSTQAMLDEGAENITQIPMTAEVLKQYLPKKSTPVQNFAKRYAVDQRYRRLAVGTLKRIMAEDVTAISVNPVFGSLWRAVCNDRENESRDELITMFGNQVERIASQSEKSQMKIWLEESYDYTAEVLETIDSVPEAQRYPCVCLDPTLAFTHATDMSEEEEEDKPITSFQRDELLEIGRSCDYRILRRLGRVLTRLTYINSAEEVPAHIAAAQDTIPRIPMSLASPEHGRRFWKILLHIVVPGTMFSARPAALLAALSIRLGVQPLLKAADLEVVLWRDRWNNLEIPETWNTSCLTLLMDADQAYRKRHAEEKADEDVSDIHQDEPPRKRLRFDEDSLLTLHPKTKPKVEGLLTPKDRALFERLANYKLLEFNLDTNLTAKTGWTPFKTKVSMGPTVTCTSCRLPRSITVMGSQGKCGLCHVKEWPSPEQREKSINTQVTKEDNAQTFATWVECNIRTCRAQYVVYSIGDLNVKPKCHFCRENSKTPAPVLECTICLNRVIYPEKYRPKAMGEFVCYACTSGRKTIIEVETTAKRLCQENNQSWLLRNDNKIAEPFSNRSLFHTISTAGVEDFCEKVELFPAPAQTKLELDGKLVRNVPELIGELKHWVDRRKTESGSCSLCFSNKRKSDLLLACGRLGCPQRICTRCLESWYGLNASGRIINTSALYCPFCRRAPTAKTLAKYGMGIHAVAELQTAVEEKGTWIFAWCKDCGHAKRYIERVCAAGAPVELNNWACDECRNWKGDERVKMCPGCGTMTEKTGGCDHITCDCGTHWCFFCGAKSTEEEIYQHMEREHGGLYGTRDADEDEDW